MPAISYDKQRKSDDAVKFAILAAYKLPNDRADRVPDLDICFRAKAYSIIPGVNLVVQGDVPVAKFRVPNFAIDYPLGGEGDFQSYYRLRL